MIEQNEEVVEETTDSVEETTEKNTEQPVEEVVEETIDESKFESAGDDSVIKVDLSKPPPKEEEVVEEKENVVEEPLEDTPVIEEITVDDLKDKEEIKEKVEEQVEEAIAEAEATGKPLPENVQKLVDFMDETGGDLQDYVNLNRDIEKMDDSDILDEYYRSTKSHLTLEERSFLLEDSFGVDEEIDDEKTIRQKKIALKEQVAMAKAHLDGQKSKYYEDIKAGSKLTKEQQGAIDFFNRYNEKSEQDKKLLEASKKTFLNKTDNINNFVSKFTSKDNTVIEDAEGYHKSLFTAMNADTIAKHFYEQGKADAIKSRVAKDKNINLDPRQTHGEINVSGVKYKVLGDTANDFKFKIKSKNKK